MSERSAGSALVLSEEQALELITFLVSAAEICLHEPIYYGTFRLIDGASRLMGMLLVALSVQMFLDGVAAYLAS